MKIPEIRSINAAAFADDSLFMATSVAGMNAMLNGPVREFCEATEIEINVDKSLVTGIDFGTGKTIDTSHIHLMGERLRSISPHQPFKYLGIQFRLDRVEADAKREIMQKVAQAAKQLENTCFTRNQIMSLAQMCVWSKLRYGSPLLDWTNAEIMKFEKINARLLKAAYKLPKCYLTAPFWLKREQGGMEAQSIRELLLKEMKSHITSCLQSEDKLKKLLIESARTISQGVGGMMPEHVRNNKYNFDPL